MYKYWLWLYFVYRHTVRSGVLSLSTLRYYVQKATWLYL